MRAILVMVPTAVNGWRVCRSAQAGVLRRWLRKSRRMGRSRIMPWQFLTPTS